MLTPTSNVVRLFYNEKCKGCENAVWIAVPRFAEDYFIDSRDYLLYRHYDCEE